MPLPALVFLRSNATPTLILCFLSTCFPLPPCGHYCPSRGISSIFIFTHLHPPPTLAAMFYLQDQMTYIPSLEACTGVCGSSPSPAALPLAPGTHCGCGSQAGSEWTRQGWGSGPAISAMESSLNSKTPKQNCTALRKRQGRRVHTNAVINISHFPSWGSVASYRPYLNIGQNEHMTQFTCFFPSNIIIAFNMIQLIITSY